jgi:hypothetical protein
MARQVFYSFHYKPDCSRAALIRSIGVIEGNRPASDNDWETVTKSGDDGIKKWIDSQLNGRSCTIVLIGENTAGRKWIKYEIEKSWKEKKGLLGIHIHQLKDFDSKQASKGRNPFEDFSLSQEKLSNIVKTYDSPYPDSKMTYGYISDNISKWIEEAIEIRNKY